MLTYTYIDNFFQFAINRYRLSADLQLTKPDDALEYLHGKQSFAQLYCDDEPVSRWCSSNWFKGILPTVFRVLVNNQHTLELTLNYKDYWHEFVDTTDYTKLYKVLSTHRAKIGGQYIIKTPKGFSKIEGVLIILKLFMSSMAWKETEARLFSVPTKYKVETVAHWLTEARYIGEFLAGEIAYYLSQQLAVKQVDEATFAFAGAGAIRSALRMQGKLDFRMLRGTKKTNIKRGEYEYTKAIRPYMEKLLALAPDYIPGYMKTWRMREVVRALGLFDIYERERFNRGLKDII